MNTAVVIFRVKRSQDKSPLRKFISACKQLKVLTQIQASTENYFYYKVEDTWNNILDLKNLSESSLQTEQFYLKRALIRQKSMIMVYGEVQPSFLN